MPRGRPRKRGEVHDLKILLTRALKKTKPKELNDILKKIILYMTYGVDVSPLFTEILMLSQTPNLLSKKMIYLYLGNYADSRPDLAMMTLNTYIRDTKSKDPKIRGLAVRSLCNMRSHLKDGMVRNTVISLIEDKSNYVKKAALYGLLKLHHGDPLFTKDANVIDRLYGMLKSADPSLLEAVINVLNELMAEEGGMVVNQKILIYLLNR